MAATAPATSWSGVIKQRKMHTTKPLVSYSSPARLPQSVANPQDPYIQMSKVLQTDGSNRACNLMVWRHQVTQDAYHQAASQQSSPARLPQSVANPQDPYIQMSKVLQTDGSNRACNLMVWRHQATIDAYHQAASQLVFTCTVAAICCKSSRSIHSNVKGLANRWQQPRLRPHGLESSSNERCILRSR